VKPCTSNASFSAAGPGTPTRVLGVVEAAVPAPQVLAVPRVSEANPIGSPARRATCRSGRAALSSRSSKASATAAGARAQAWCCHRPRWGAGWGRGGRGCLPGRDPRAQHPALPSHLPCRPLASLAAARTARHWIQAHLFLLGFGEPCLAGTLGSDADGYDFSFMVLCVHRQDR
jgi:hypothetical protein